MFEHSADVILVTANSTVRKDDSLVMGRGAALELNARYPDCDFIFGKLINEFKQQTSSNTYGLIFTPYKRPMIGIFQVKHFWGNPAKLELIVASCDVLQKMALLVWANNRISLNFPGIGNGQLRRKDVLPLLLNLPDNVTVWEKP